MKYFSLLGWLGKPLNKKPIKQGDIVTDENDDNDGDYYNDNTYPGKAKSLMIS